MGRRRVARKPPGTKHVFNIFEVRKSGALVFCLLAVVVSLLVHQYRKERVADEVIGWVADYEIISTLPHGTDSFTQGFLFSNGSLVETVGQFGKSRVLRIDADTGDIIKETAFPDSDFAEGISSTGTGEFAVLTWQSGRGYLVDSSSLDFKGEWKFDGDGWGLTLNEDERELYLSDGSATIRVLDPGSLKETRRIQVADRGRSIHLLNELEFIGDEIWANVYGTLLLARIDPLSGTVNSWVDCYGIFSVTRETVHVSIMNGIAYDRERNRLFVTGKNWPYIYQIRVLQDFVVDDVAYLDPIFFNRSYLSSYQRALSLKVDVSGVPLSRSRGHW
ncbi:hypothetical protein NDN08_006984 [Rhodosorus marinus]|uniref:Glutamine cyclotransferase n=1 Tax=Rhodosorus marinus TaxID=101924 RepID=A0AAV8UJ74_9RHOD|nr:hypothetical protein NDN08_006984 [Rhodosorus marinus]